MSTATKDAASTATVEKTPSKKSQADAIFAAKLVDLKAGKFTTNKEFRAAVLTQICTALNVSVASAATMYNSAKKTVEDAGEVKLGRDPKKEKPVSTGKRGRPSKKTEATVTVVALEAEAADVA